MIGNSNRLVIAITLALILFAGCSQQAGSPMSPAMTPDGNRVAESNRVLWGMWQVTIDKTTSEVDIVPVRGALFNVNVQRFLSPPAVPVNMMTIKILPETDLSQGLVVCEVSLRHPFLGLNEYKGFDVRGIFMADGATSSDHDSAICFGSAEANEAHMLNADGLTRWWNATEFTDKMPLFSYKPGKLGIQYFPTATLNPYKYFADDLDAESPVWDLDPATRGVFAPTTSPNTRRYEIVFPIVGSQPQIIFNYAVDASWEPPDPSFYPEYPIEAFGPGSQCQEAYAVKSDEEGDAWFYEDDSGGTARLFVEVFDWQGASSPSGVPSEISAIWIESPVLTNPVDILPFASVSPGTETSSVFMAEFSGSDLMLTSSGDFPFLGSVESASPDNYQPQLDGGEVFVYPDGPLAAYFTGTIHIGGEQAGTGPKVYSIDPDSGYIDFKYENVQIGGENFQDGATVKLVKSDNPSVIIDGTDVVFVDSENLTCTFDLDSFAGNSESGVYDVVVKNPDDQEGSLDEGFEVLEYPCAPNEWGDDFESYPLSTYPSAGGWVNFWSGASAYVTNEQAYSGTQSLRLEAYSSWARYDGLPFTHSNRTYICYETRVMLTNPNKKAIVGFAWKTTPSTTGHYAAIGIGNPTYTEAYHWYHVLAKINMTDNTWYVWVDGEKVVDGTSCGNQTSHDSFTHFFVGCGNFTYDGSNSVIYYDDVWLYWEN
ncbi:MAG: hypothetical protein ABIC40_06290 [bacterium]